jgi:hypothetical protein
VVILYGVGAVSPGYAHVSKLARAAPSISLDESVLKWYDLAPADAPVPAEIHELARECLREGARSGELELVADLGFVILHRCGGGFYFLLVTTWRNQNELWQTVWAKDGDADPVFRPWQVDGTHRPTFCVWELGAVAHEQQAWIRYLRSPRDGAARQAYLRDSFEGPV